MVHVIARIVIADGKVDAFHEVAEELINTTRTENGCLSYTLYAGENENTFFFIEDWENQECLEAHFATEHFTRLIPQIGDISAEDPRLEITHPIERYA